MAAMSSPPSNPSPSPGPSPGPSLSLSSAVRRALDLVARDQPRWAGVIEQRAGANSANSTNSTNSDDTALARMRRALLADVLIASEVMYKYESVVRSSSQG